MKERFKELAEQAGLYDFVIEAMGVDEELTNFAELIVRECADIATINSHQQYSAGFYVLKHFGMGGV
jgi:hypothetical protein